MIAAAAALYVAATLTTFTYLARTRRREGNARDDARRAVKALGWSLAWPLTALSYALGHLYRLINELGR